jgi:SAM-dependent methyltransferase
MSRTEWAPMRRVAQLWLMSARLRQRASRGTAPREELIRQHVGGRTFADIGCMWSVHGQLTFVAEQSGATAVTGLDVMDATTEYLAEHDRRRSRVRFVKGDIHDAAAAAEVGPHDVVWCSGVLYHSSDPLQTLRQLHAITRETLILATETIPEVPGLAQACVFYPGLGPTDRRVHQSARPHAVAIGITSSFERADSYGAWWWGLSASAVTAMLAASGFDVVRTWQLPLHLTVIATPRHA